MTTYHLARKLATPAREEGGPPKDTGGADDTRQRFTGKERDSESGLDYFGARYYGGAQGRFTSADPKPVTEENFVNPQRWQMYAYVNNNPLAAYDPNGEEDQGKDASK